MKEKTLGNLALACLVFTAAWLGLMIAGMATSAPIDSQESAIAYAQRGGWLFSLSYINAALVTISAALLFAGLALYFRKEASFWSAGAVVFVPVYAGLNLLVYLSQVSVLPRLLALRGASPDPAVDLMLGQWIQAWAPSAIAFANTLAYAVLGIASLIMGSLLARGLGLARWGGVLLALNGAACILGLAGSIAGNSALAQGTLAGGGLFLLALILLSVAFLRPAPRAQKARPKSKAHLGAR